MLLKSVVAVCLMAVPAAAQVRDTASLFGTITDSQSAVVPGATVTINNAATGVSRSVVTDNSAVVRRRNVFTGGEDIGSPRTRPDW